MLPEPAESRAMALPVRRMERAVLYFRTASVKHSTFSGDDSDVGDHAAVIGVVGIFEEDQVTRRRFLLRKLLAPVVDSLSAGKHPAVAAGGFHRPAPFQRRKYF